MERYLWFSLIMFSGVVPITAPDPQNAFSNDINSCMFTALTIGTTRVLGSTPACGAGFTGLCYGLGGTAKFAVCYKTATLTPAFTGHIVEQITGAGRPAKFKKDTGTYAPTAQAEVADYSVPQQINDYPTFNERLQEFCAKGHLVPNGDFGPDDQRALTFILANIAPQWQLFNGGNWAVLEAGIQRYINAKPAGRKIYVFTGVDGQATDSSGRVYKMNGKVEAPKYYWKAICDPIDKTSVVYIGENPVGVPSASIDTDIGCTGRRHTKKLGVMKCESLNKAKSSYPSFKLPDFYDANCRISTRGTFLDAYTPFR